MSESLRSLNALVAVGAITAASLALNACGSDENNALLHGPDGTSVDGTVPGIGGDISDETDQTLRDGNYKCASDTYNDGDQASFAFEVDFYTADAGNKELMQSVFDKRVDDRQYGMGQEAFDLLKKYAPTNNNTTKEMGDQTTGDADFDSFIKTTFSYTLEQDTVLTNGDCRHGDFVSLPSPDRPHINLQSGSTVRGFLMPAEHMTEWTSAVKEHTGGKMPFWIAPEVIKTKVGDKEMTFYIVALSADGCGNEVRVPEFPPETPGTTNPDKHPVPLVGANTDPGAGGSQEQGSDPQDDSGSNGYGPGDDRPTVPTTLAPITSENGTPAETGDRPTDTSVLANGNSGTPPVNGDPSQGGSGAANPPQD